MKHLNHRGSAGVLAFALLLAALMILSTLGVNGDWKPKTTPWRLVNEPFIGWALLVFLGAGLAFIRAGTETVQCVNALLFVGMLSGLGLASGLFWDAWLFTALTATAMPVLQSARQTLQSSSPPLDARRRSTQAR